MEKTGLEKYRQTFPKATEDDFIAARAAAKSKTTETTRYVHAESGELIPVKKLAAMMTEEGGYGYRPDQH